MPTSSRSSLVLILVLAIALAVGAAASLLIGAATAHTPTGGTATLVIFPEWLLSYVLLGFGIAIIGFLIYLRLSGGTVPVPGRPVITVLLVVLMAVIFIAAAHYLYPGGLVSANSTPPGGGNSTTSGSGNTSSNASGSGGQLGGVLWSPTFPAWLPLAVVGGVLLVVVAVGVPLVRSYLAERPSRQARAAPTEDAGADLRRALTVADQELAAGSDPRSVILALYASVIDRLTRMVGSVEIETPEEIRAHHLVRLGIQPDAAKTLTRLFEEARYSSHPLDAAAVAAARQAVRQALADLGRSPVPA